VTNKKILLVEDYDDAREIMRLFIEAHGYEVIEASDGLEAIERAGSECPCLILMDLGLPNVNGLDATRRIKTEICPRTPVVAVTAFSDMRDEAIAAGCLDVISKPMDYFQIGEVIKKFITA